ncbi:hypothetical protein BJ684DRAFT_14657 [Piptocephalis cylindrospora]|uniref:C3H1-type domain-containing protein n=1 Tax=Piptocephalis cylindrospora TaxID=1907219 RepID=A0A4P9Y7S1_9FUNG|nr:hypothetical protein BJ684DRAFT_14657 [Piptocephalis cylindrospora]|eukprot:RKP15055.1 hypothetical protein BJ684DRAFT_14657 [Piptocephalis cylindrospora]
MGEDTIKSSQAASMGAAQDSKTPPHTPIAPCFFFQRGTCLSGSQCTFRHTLLPSKGKDPSRKAHAGGKNQKNSKRKTKTKSMGQNHPNGGSQDLTESSTGKPKAAPTRRSIPSDPKSSMDIKHESRTQGAKGRNSASKERPLPAPLPTSDIQSTVGIKEGKFSKAGKSTRRCYLFQKGRCVHGDRCRYAHVTHTPSTSVPSSPVPREFQPHPSSPILREFQPHPSSPILREFQSNLSSPHRKLSTQSMELPFRESKGKAGSPVGGGRENRKRHGGLDNQGSSQPNSPSTLCPPAGPTGVRKGSYDSRVDALFGHQHPPSSFDSPSYSYYSASSAATCSTLDSSDSLSYTSSSSSSISSTSSEAFASASSSSPSTPSNLPEGWPEEWKAYGEPAHHIPFALTATYQHLMSEEDDRGAEEVVPIYPLSSSEPKSDGQWNGIRAGCEEDHPGGIDPWRRRPSQGPNLQAVSEGEALLLMHDSLPHSPEMQRHARVVLQQGTDTFPRGSRSSPRSQNRAIGSKSVGGKGKGRPRGEDVSYQGTSHSTPPYPYSHLPPSLSHPPSPDFFVDCHHALPMRDAEEGGGPSLGPKPHLHDVLTSAQQLLWELEALSQREPWKKETGTAMHRLALATDRLIGDVSSLEQRCEEQQGYILALERLLSRDRMD